MGLLPSRSPGAEDGEPSAESILHAHGLKKVGKLWILPEEQNLRDHLATLKRFDDRYRDANSYVEQLLDANEAILAHVTKLDEIVKKTREAAAAAKAGTPQKKQLDTELKNEETTVEQLRKPYIPPEKLGNAPPLKPALVDRVNARTEATLKFLAYRDTPDDLPQRYDQVRADPSIAAAIAALSPPGQLGPLKGLHDKWRFTVDKLDSSLLSDTLPVYRDGHVFRFTAIINDRRPLTFTFDNTGEPTVIPQNQAETAGLTIDPQARKVNYHISEGRDVAARVVKIPQIRLGRNVLNNVEAYILPPEAADVGARVGPNSLPGYRVTINAARFLLTVEGTKQ